MRIAVITASFLPEVGGAQYCVHYLAREWARAGHEVTVVNTTSDSPPDPAAGYSVRRLGLLRGSTRFGYHRFPFRHWVTRQLDRILKNDSPDFVSSHTAYPTALWLAHLPHPTRFVLTCHGGDITTAPWGARARYGIDSELRTALGRAERVIAISRSARRLVEDLGVPPERVVDIPNGVDVDRFTSRVDVDLRSELGLPRGALLILSVAHNRPPKGLEVGVRAFARARERGLDAHYLIVGQDASVLTGLARELGQAARIHPQPPLTGDRLAAAYQQAEVYLAPSWDELFPLVLLEAMASGLAVVATDISGHQDVVRPGENGFLVGAGDVEEMARALLELGQDPSARESIGKTNRQRAHEFRWEEISRRYLELA
jgi:glycosyltransferase involved in cell wall biosynthesis